MSDSRRPAREGRTGSPSERGRGPSLTLALCLFAFLFSVYLLAFSGVYHSSDEMAMLAATDSLARRGAWDIELLRWMGEQQGSFGPDGHLYSRKGIGTTLAALPVYWLALRTSGPFAVGNVQAAMLTNAVLTAMTGVLVYASLRRLAYRDGVSLITALAFSVGTMAWPYARYLFSETLAGLGLMLSFYALLRYRDRLDAPSVLLAGVGLGMALLARLSNVVVAPFIGLLLLVYLRANQGRNWRAWVMPIILFGIPVLAALAISGWYNWVRFGSPWITGYLPQERFSTPFLEGFYGLTFSPGKGLFWYNPLLLAALISWPAFFRRPRQRAEALLVALVVLGTIVFYAPWFLWWAGHGWGPRFLVTVLPFATLPLASAVEAARRSRTAAVILGIIGLISIIVQIQSVTVDFNLYLEDIYAKMGLYHPATLFDPAHSPLLHQITYLRPGNLDLAWARGGELDPVALLVAVGLVLASGLALWAAWRKRQGIWAALGLLVLVGVGTLFSLVRYAPAGDVALASQALAMMERPGEAVLVINPLNTEAFQDAYDGRLPIWGVPSREEVIGEYEGIWTVGRGTSEAAEARFRAGDMQLDLVMASGQSPLVAGGRRFEDERLAVTLLDERTRLGDVAYLVAAHLEGYTIPVGGTLSLSLFWRALSGSSSGRFSDTSYTVFVQVIDDAGAKAGQVDRQPCAGDCPTTTWRPGDLVGERYDLPIAREAHPGSYRVIVGMYDPKTGERVIWFDEHDNEIGDSILIDSVQVVP